MSEQKSKRIAQNTGMLYFRMILIMLVSLYTVRIVLNTLGVIDYGVYNVVAGVVSMMSFLSGTMTSACQRFFAFELGQNNVDGLKKSFGASLTIFIIISLFFLLVFETLGLWFLNTKMVIPAEKMNAANWVYQFAIFSFITTLVLNPFSAAIIAHEDMKIYAYLSVVEVLLKLLIVYLLVFFSYDKLILYGFLMFVVTLATSFMYIYICIRKYKECRFNLSWDIVILKPIASYAGWNMMGALSNVLKMQGTNILLNLFFGPIVNTARAIASQINAALSSFLVNIYMAVRPQITKSYAIGDKEYMMQLVFKSAKASYFLLLVLSMPILLETNFVLKLWLDEVPEYTVIFTRLLIINILIESINNQLFAAVQASGRIKIYQIFICSLQMLILPISYLSFYFGAKPEMTMYISIIMTLICFIPQLIITKKIVGLFIPSYLRQVVFVIFYVTVISFVLPLVVYNNMEDGILRFLIVCTVCLISCLLATYYIGFTTNERLMLKKLIYNKLSK